MHLVVLLAIFALAWGLRCNWTVNHRATWSQRWDRTVSIFLLSPLLLFTTSISIVWMGPHGRMVWVGNDWFSHVVAIGFLGCAGLYLLKLTSSGWRLLQQVRTYPTTQLGGKKARILDLSTPYIAQIGFWQPELVVTQGLLDHLGIEHLGAVLAHEQAHYRYRDTYCFFWLGWIRQITTWLPQTEAMWQELLVLRELRADRWASRQTDPLLVAEALLLVVQPVSIFTESFCTAFSQVAPVDRLNQRIDALLAISQPTLDTAMQGETQSSDLYNWLWLLFALIPLLAIPFHK
jgi:Zn-dependent protease with chaperone function